MIIYPNIPRPGIKVRLLIWGDRLRRGEVYDGKRFLIALKSQIGSIRGAFPWCNKWSYRRGWSKQSETVVVTSPANLALIEINQIAEPSNLGNKKPNPQFILVSALRLYDRIITFVTLHLKHIYDFEK